MISSHTASVIACRVLGLYIAFWWLGLLPVEFYWLLRGPSFTWLFLGTAITLAIPITILVILWKLAPWIAKQMLADLETTQDSPSTITLEEAQSVAVSVLGLLFIVGAIPSLAVVLVEYLNVHETVSDADMKSLVSVNAVRSVVMHVTKIVLGIWLFLGAHSIVRVFQRTQKK